MKKTFLLMIILSLLSVETMHAQEDSLFFYKSGGIIYKVPAYAVDSVTFVPLDYYQTLRCNTVLNDLKSNPLLTRFAQMIQIAGYEKKLDNTTILAPVNNALSLVNLSDTALVRKIVANQITSAQICTGMIADSLLVPMLNGKRYLFKAASGSYYVDSISMLTPNVYSARSIIHIMNGYIRYNLNVWEYITQGSGHDSMKAFVNSHTKTTYDTSTGIFKTTNDLRTQLAITENELSNMSAIIPGDEAWNDAYTKLYPYCAAPYDSVVDSHAEATKSAIVFNSFFAGKLNPALTDTTYTAISGFQLKSPSVMLDGAQTTKVSNGTCYTVNQLKMYNPEYWSREIKIEAEDNSWGRTMYNYAVSLASGNGASFTLSNNNYLTLTDLSTNGLVSPYATFPIPNTLSGKYNIYCVFVPSTADNLNDQRPYKVKFYLSYLNNKSSNGTDAPMGVKVTNASIDATNTVQSPTSTSAVFTTNPTTMTKMLVAKDFTFPFSNLICNDPTKISVSLKVQNATAKTTADMANYNRNLRIDCIILESVQ